jgi:hypothetical protein
VEANGEAAADDLEPGSAVDGHLDERTPPVRVGRHAAPPGTRARFRSRHAAPPLAGDELHDGASNDDGAPDDWTDDEADEADAASNPPPNLGPPPERLDFRRKKRL